jgi:hypothetical protein
MKKLEESPQKFLYGYLGANGTQQNSSVQSPFYPGPESTFNLQEQQNYNQTLASLRDFEQTIDTDSLNYLMALNSIMPYDQQQFGSSYAQPPTPTDFLSEYSNPARLVTPSPTPSTFGMFSTPVPQSTSPMENMPPSFTNQRINHNMAQSINSIQAWSEFLSRTGPPILSIDDEGVPTCIVGGKSVTKKRRTPLDVSMEIDQDRLRVWVETIIQMVIKQNPILEQVEAFSQVCARNNLFVDLELLRNRLNESPNQPFNESLISAEIELLMNGQEQDKGLERDPSSTKFRNIFSEDDLRKGYAVQQANSSCQTIRFVSLKAKLVSNNKTNCQLRYKLTYDSWLLYKIDSYKKFAINCGKTMRKERKNSQANEVGGSIKKQSQDDDKIRTPALSSKRQGKSKKRQHKGDDHHDEHMDIHDDEDEDHEHSHDDAHSPDHHHHHSPGHHVKHEESHRSPEAHHYNHETTEAVAQHAKPSSPMPQSGPGYFISPTRGSTNGGYFAFIQIINIQIEIGGSSEQSKIYFGEQEAEIQQINNNAFFVKVPAQPQEGAVPIKIISGNITLTNNQQLVFEYYKPTEAESTITSPINNNKRKSSAIMQPPTAPNKRLKETTSTVSRSVYRREWAVVIAISKYKSKKLLHQSTSINDATNLANVLEKNYGFTVCTLFNEQATKENILQLLVSISEKLYNDDCVMIYYAGHSIHQRYPNANNHVDPYICPYDCDPDKIINTGIPHQTFVNYRMFAAKHILYILDTCYSDKLFKIKTGASDVLSNQSDFYSRNRAVQLICAGSDTHQATDADRLQGLFSKHLLNALTTMRFGRLLNQDTQPTPGEPNFSTADQLGMYIQARVMQESNGTQVPNFGKLEIDDGQFMFFPRISSGYNSELERVISLMSVYEEYMQNMNLGDIHTSENLMNLLKIKFFQVSKFYLDALSSLLANQRLVLRSDHYSFHRVNLTEILNTAKKSYLAVYRPVDEWSNAHKHQLADMNHQMIVNNKNAIAKRIFLLHKNSTEEKELKDVLEVMKYHSSRGVDVRVAFLEDLKHRRDIPHNLSIIDSRLCHVIMREDEYPKSVLIFNRKTVADMYYSCWVYLYHVSISLSEYLEQIHEDPDKKSPSSPQDKEEQHHEENSADLFLAVTDPLLSFDTEENVKSIQHQLNPILKGFKNRFASLLTVPFLQKNNTEQQLTENAKRLLFEKFQKLNMFYENVLTTFYSLGRIETNAQFYDRHRLRSHELEKTVDKKLRAVIPVHSWNQCPTVVCEPHFSTERVQDMAEMNRRFIKANRTIDTSIIFTFHQQVITDTHFDLNGIVGVLEYFEKSQCKVIIRLMESIEHVLLETPGSFVIIDDCLCQITTLNVEQVPHSENGNKQDTNTYYLNTLTADRADIKQKQEEFDRLSGDTVTVAQFKERCISARPTLFKQQ